MRPSGHTAGCSPRLAISIAVCFPGATVPSADREDSSRNLGLQVIRHKALRGGRRATPGSSKPIDRTAGRSQEQKALWGESLILGWASLTLSLAHHTAPSFLPHQPASLPGLRNNPIFWLYISSLISFLNFQNYLETLTVWHRSQRFLTASDIRSAPLKKKKNPLTDGLFFLYPILEGKEEELRRPLISCPLQGRTGIPTQL